MDICNVCKGGGLVGVGENPHLKEGPLSTCANCAGTGKAIMSEVTGTKSTASVDSESVAGTEIIEPKKNEEL